MDAASPQIQRSYRWYEVWGKVYLQPKEQSFHEILADPRYHVRRALFWVALSGFAAAFLDNAPSSVAGWNLSDALLMSILLGPLIAVFALLMLSLLPVHASGKFSTEKEKNRFVYCVAAALSPTALVYGVLLAVSQLLARVELNFDALLNALAVIATIYLFWLVANAFRAVTYQPPRVVRTPVAIQKSLGITGILLVLTVVGYGALYFFYFVPRETARLIVLFVTLIAFVAAVILIVRLGFGFIDLPLARRISEQGWASNGVVRKKWAVSVPIRARGVSGTATVYYAFFAYPARGGERTFSLQLALDQYERLNIGDSIQVRYLPDQPELIQVRFSIEAV